jgi:hypothetical protein
VLLETQHDRERALMASAIEGYRLVDDGYPTFKKIVVGRKWVGRVVKRVSDYEAVVGTTTIRGATERAAFEAIVTALLGHPAATGRQHPTGRGTIGPRMTTHVVAEQALKMLVENYKAGLHPTTYGELARRCGFEEQNVRWFGQVTDLIDAACALAGVPSFALVRVREASGNINPAAWRNSGLRDRVVAKALAGSWNDESFAKIEDALALFSLSGLGNKKAWEYVRARIDLEAWAGTAIA